MEKLPNGTSVNTPEEIRALLADNSITPEQSATLLRIFYEGTEPGGDTQSSIQSVFDEWQADGVNIPLSLQYQEPLPDFLPPSAPEPYFPPDYQEGPEGSAIWGDVPTGWTAPEPWTPIGQALPGFGQAQPQEWDTGLPPQPGPYTSPALGSQGGITEPTLEELFPESPVTPAGQETPWIGEEQFLDEETGLPIDVPFNPDMEADYWRRISPEGDRGNMFRPEAWSGISPEEYALQMSEYPGGRQSLFYQQMAGLPQQITPIARSIAESRFNPLQASFMAQDLQRQLSAPNYEQFQLLPDQRGNFLAFLKGGGKALTPQGYRTAFEAFKPLFTSPDLTGQQRTVLAALQDPETGLGRDLLTQAALSGVSAPLRKYVPDVIRRKFTALEAEDPTRPAFGRFINLPGWG